MLAGSHTVVRWSGFGRRGIAAAALCSWITRAVHGAL